MCATIAVAMSGGVDSSAAAWLLQREGHKILGLTVEMFHRDCPFQDIADAKAVADHLGFPHRAFDFSPHFREGQAEARELGMYMQKYCGCIFSEEDRYLNQKKKKKKASETPSV